MNPADVGRIREFIVRFIDAEKTAREQTEFFADRVEYYDLGIADRTAILHDVDRFMRVWPRRNYELEEINYIQPDPDSDSVFVSYTIEFEVANSARTIFGKASYGVLIRDLAYFPKVESIREKVTERKSVPTSRPQEANPL